MRARDPYVLFRKWFADAVKAGTKLPEAMALATASRKGAPSVRIVLNRGLDRRGFAFFTNYHSRKGADLRSNPRAALVFHWPLVERQVRAEGRVRKLTRAESDRYFHSRPRESRLSAWISPQSEEIPDRAFLEDAYARARRASRASASRGRRSGAGSVSSRTQSSSGRDSRTGSTTA